jgi:hypothetical protein
MSISADRRRRPRAGIAACVLLLLITGTAGAGPSPVEEIKRRYEEVNKQIRDKASVYKHSLRINEAGAEAPGVGTYDRTVTYFMGVPDGEHTSVWDAVPLKITVSSREADDEYFCEYLFDKRRRLVFVHVQSSEGERRYYLQGDKLIRVVTGKDGKDGKDSKDGKDGKEGKEVNDKPPQDELGPMQRKARELLGLLGQLKGPLKDLSW